MLKITGFTGAQVDALDQVFADLAGTGLFSSTKTTATWSGDYEDPAVVLNRVCRFMDAEMDAGRTRHHPRASLHGVVRKLKGLQTAPGPAPDTATSPEPRENLGEVSDGETSTHDLHVAALRATMDEIDTLVDRQKAYDQDALRLQDEQAKAEATGNDKLAAKLNQQMHRALNAATTIGEKIATLRSPAEVTRRVQLELDRQQSRERLNALRQERSTGMATTKTPKPKAAPKPTAKDQGFPEAYLGANGNFKPGFDARAKSDLILSVIGGTNGERKGMLVTFEEAQAMELLKVRGWTGFLDRKREIVAAKAAKADERKAAAKAKVEAKSQAKPDPKPKRTRKAKA